MPVTEAVLLAADPKLDADWWRQAAVYQIYPRSFADSNGDGIGDIAGVTSRIGYLAALGVDAIWLSPFYPSALADGGYDVADYRDVAPELGTLDDFDALVAAAHAAGIQGDRRHRAQPHLRPAPVVPGGAGLRAGLGRPRPLHLPRRHRPGRRSSRRRTGSRTSAARPGPGCPTASGTATCSRPSSPTSTGTTARCATTSCTTLRFWADRGVDGYRVDVAHALAKDLSEPLRSKPTLEDEGVPLDGTDPLYDRNEVHEIYAEWREVFNSYDPPRTAVAEAYAPSERRALYARPTGLGQAFNFDLLKADFSARGVPRRDHLLPERGGEDRLVLDLGAVQPRRRPPRLALRAAGRHRLRRLADDRRRSARLADEVAGPAPGPGGDAADAGPARLGVPLPGRGTRPARGRRPAGASRCRTRSGSGR